MKPVKNRLSLAVFVWLCCAVSSAWAQQPAPDTKWKLDKVNFVGLQTRKPEEMTAVSGLRIGETIDLAAIRAATAKLSESGVFKKVSSRYAYRGDLVEVTFTVEEAPVTKAACVFDNFVWFSDEELRAAVKRELPEFDGTAASDDLTISAIKKSLTGLLQERKLAGTVVYERGFDPGGGETPHIFTVKAPNLKVCAVHINGLKANLKRELDAALKQHLYTEYSRTESNLFVRAALLPVFQNNGYLKARFASVQARPAANGECKDAGVLVIAAVEEGLQYRWQGVTWTGNQVFSVKELEREWKLKPGDIANLDSINDSFELAHFVFGTRGYLTARITEQPVYDDAQRLVGYQATVTEGPQFHFGQLSLTGLSDSDTKHWQGRWKLKPGEVFNTTLVGEFTRELRQDASIKDFDVKYKRDAAKLIADVEIEVKK